MQTANIADGSVTNAKLALSSITLNTGGGLTGGGVVSLGGNLSLSTTATSANTSNAIVSRAADGSFTAGAMTATGAAQFMFNASSSNTLGTWTGLANTSTGGVPWSIVSSGAGNSTGAGKLLFTPNATTAASAMVLTAGGLGVGTLSPQRLLQVGDAGNTAGSEGSHALWVALSDHFGRAHLGNRRAEE